MSELQKHLVELEEALSEFVDIGERIKTADQANSEYAKALIQAQQTYNESLTKTIELLESKTKAIQTSSEEATKNSIMLLKEFRELDQQAQFSNINNELKKKAASITTCIAEAQSATKRNIDDFSLATSSLLEGKAADITTCIDANKNEIKEELAEVRECTKENEVLYGSLMAQIKSLKLLVSIATILGVINVILSFLP